MNAQMDDRGLCGARFDTPDGTAVCETFGPHDRHGGVLVVGVFRCHQCYGVTKSASPVDEYRDRMCRCVRPVVTQDEAQR